jgi:hypothetical protein
METLTARVRDLTLEDQNRWQQRQQAMGQSSLTQLPDDIIREITRYRAVRTIQAAARYMLIRDNNVLVAGLGRSVFVSVPAMPHLISELARRPELSGQYRAYVMPYDMHYPIEIVRLIWASSESVSQGGHLIQMFIAAAPGRASCARQRSELLSPFDAHLAGSPDRGGWRVESGRCVHSASDSRPVQLSPLHLQVDPGADHSADC